MPEGRSPFLDAVGRAKNIHACARQQIAEHASHADNELLASLAAMVETLAEMIGELHTYHDQRIAELEGALDAARNNVLQSSEANLHAGRGAIRVPASGEHVLSNASRVGAPHGISTLSSASTTPTASSVESSAEASGIPSGRPEPASSQSSVEPNDLAGVPEESLSHANETHIDEDVLREVLKDNEDVEQLVRRILRRERVSELLPPTPVGASGLPAPDTRLLGRAGRVVQEYARRLAQRTQR